MLYFPRAVFQPCSHFYLGHAGPRWTNDIEVTSYIGMSNNRTYGYLWILWYMMYHMIYQITNITWIWYMIPMDTYDIWYLWYMMIPDYPTSYIGIAIWCIDSNRNIGMRPWFLGSKSGVIQWDHTLASMIPMTSMMIHQISFGFIRFSLLLDPLDPVPHGKISVTAWPCCGCGLPSCVCVSSWSRPISSNSWSRAQGTVFFVDKIGSILCWLPIFQMDLYRKCNQIATHYLILAKSIGVKPLGNPNWYLCGASIHLQLGPLTVLSLSCFHLFQPLINRCLKHRIYIYIWIYS